MPSDASTDNESTYQLAVERITNALDGLAYGSVEITVHDGRIVQIERCEKTRVKIPVACSESDSPAEHK